MGLYGNGGDGCSISRHKNLRHNVVLYLPVQHIVHQEKNSMTQHLNNDKRQFDLKILKQNYYK